MSPELIPCSVDYEEFSPKDVKPGSVLGVETSDDVDIGNDPSGDDIQMNFNAIDGQVGRWHTLFLKILDLKL